MQGVVESAIAAGRRAVSGLVAAATHGPRSGRCRRHRARGHAAAHAVGDQAGPVRDQVGALLIQQTQSAREVLTCYRSGVSGQRSNAGCRGRVDHVGLATSTAGELEPGQWRYTHVLDPLSAGDQPVRQVPAPGRTRSPPPNAGR